MIRPGFRAVLLTSLLLLAGCSAPVNPTSGDESTTPPTEPRTAHFLFNNEESRAYDVTVYLVTNQNESQEFFPMRVTYENGTTRTVADYNSAALLAAPEVEAFRPAHGTVLVVNRRLPAHTSLLLSVKNAPPHAKSLTITTGVNSETKQWSLSSSICTGSQADVAWYRPDSTSGVLCGNVSDVSYPNSRIHQVVSVDTTEDQPTDNPEYLLPYRDVSTELSRTVSRRGLCYHREMALIGWLE